MRIENTVRLDFDDVLIKPKRSTLQSRADVDLERSFTFLHSKQVYQGIPIIASNMDSVGNEGTAKVLGNHKMITWLHKFHDPLKLLEIDYNYAALSIGGAGGYIPEWHKYVRVDVANGHREEFVEAIASMRESNQNITIFAGNVCTPEMTEQLLIAGADVVVVGIGSGGQCTTRLKSGVGYPQLSAVIECADAAHGLKGHIVSDGGCRTPADVCKAFGAGADFVALGSMLAAHTENTNKENIIEKGGYYNKEIDSPAAWPGQGTYVHGAKYAKVYGMSSKDAMDKYYGGVADHRSAEGKTTLIEMRGPLEDTIKDILGGLRSCCTYTGSTSLKELSKRTTFVMVNRTHNTYYEDEVK